MACEEQKLLAKFIKEVHSSLREISFLKGSETAWQEHLENRDVLVTYAECMNTLATTHWETNSAKDTSLLVSRIKWAADFCYDYFIKKIYLIYKEKDIDIAHKINISLDKDEHFETPVRLIDVGSCYNPFKKFDFLDVLAVDLCPANNTVLQCDFLSVNFGSKTVVEDSKVIQLQQHWFDVVTFCFLLEYIPDSKLRIKACENAYCILRPGGLLIIITPDSKHVGANSKLMKCWRYTLACMGFSRIKYEKFKHMHCMAFRKSLHQNIAIRWSKLYKESYMECVINIPQDFQDINHKDKLSTRIKATSDDFQELPFYCHLDD